jgi:glutaminyl-peptide cyclotransferase
MVRGEFSYIESLLFVSHHSNTYRARLYRHLAEKWESTYVNSHSKRRMLGPSVTELAGLEAFVLLDLLGAPSPQIRSYFQDTHWLFDAMVSAEQRLHSAGLLLHQGEADADGRVGSFFVPRHQAGLVWGHIEDDHIPFLKRGVSVLHVIASPFPRVWHTLLVSVFPALHFFSLVNDYLG